MLADKVWKKRENTGKAFAYRKFRRMEEKTIIKLRDDEENEEFLYPEESYEHSSSWIAVKERNASLYDKTLLPLFDNGLVCDISYYKSLRNFGDYILAYYTKCNLKISDYESLITHPTVQARDCEFYTLAHLNKCTKIKVLKCRTFHEFTPFKITYMKHCDTLYVLFKKSSEYNLLRIVHNKKEVIIFIGFTITWLEYYSF